VSKYAVYEFLINGTVYCGFTKFQYKSQVQEIVELYLDYTTDRVYHSQVIEDYKKYKKYDGFKIIKTFDFREEAEELTQRLRNEETRPSYNRKTNKKIVPRINFPFPGDDAIIEHFKNKIRELFDSEENLSLSISEIIMKINPRLIGSSPNYIHTAINFLHKEGYLISDDCKKYKKYNGFKEVLSLPSCNERDKVSKYAVYSLIIDNKVYYGISMYISNVQLINRVNMWLDDSKDEHIYNYEVINAYNKFGSCVLEIKEIVNSKEEATKIKFNLIKSENKLILLNKHKRKTNHPKNVYLKSSINFEDLIMKLFNSKENLVLSVSEIARRIGHPNSDERGTNYHNYPVHNAVNTLVKRGYLCKDSNGSKTQVYLPTTNAPPLPNKWVI